MDRLNTDTKVEGLVEVFMKRQQPQTYKITCSS